MADDVGWGILATGKIAQTFARDLALVPGARLAAVGSCSFTTAVTSRSVGSLPSVTT